MVEYFRRGDLVGNANRLGFNYRIYPSKWPGQNSFRGEIENDSGE